MQQYEPWAQVGTPPACWRAGAVQPGWLKLARKLPGELQVLHQKQLAVVSLRGMAYHAQP